jgi:hypothetical protein
VEGVGAVAKEKMKKFKTFNLRFLSVAEKNISI